MQRITRAQLQTAADDAKNTRVREQTLLGQKAANAFYTQIVSAAVAGELQCTSMSMSPGTAFDSALAWIKDHFPDCKVMVEIHGLHGDPEYRSYAIRVNWDPCDG